MSVYRTDCIRCGAYMHTSASTRCLDDMCALCVITLGQQDAGNESTAPTQLATPTQGEAPMVDNEDTQIRLEALRLAVQLGVAEHDTPELIKESAAIFHKFLSEQAASA